MGRGWAPCWAQGAAPWGLGRGLVGLCDAERGAISCCALPSVLAPAGHEGTADTDGFGITSVPRTKGT